MPCPGTTWLDDKAGLTWQGIEFRAVGFRA